MAISIEDRKLVESHRAGDREAFAEIVRAHAPSLLGHALRNLSDRAAAEDAVQETFARAYRALPRFDGEYKVGPWLHRILANVCADEGNRRRREAEKVDRVGADPITLEPFPGIEDQLGLDFDDDLLRRALDELSPSYREALSLRFVDELSYPELAEVTGISEENARARVSRARTAVRTALRGVAAIPLLLVGALRRGERAAAALSPAAEPSASAAAAAAAGTSSAPLVAKAVIGLGMAAIATVPTTGPAIVERERAVVPAEVVETELPAPLPGTGASTRPSETAPAPTEAGVPSEATDQTPSSLLGEPGSSLEEGGEVVLLPAQGAEPDGATDATDVDAVDETAPPATVVTVPAPPVLHAGSLVVTGLVLTPAGPRLDVAGSVVLNVDGAIRAGTVSGRIAVGAAAPGEPRSTEGTLTLRLEGGETVEIRFSGLAAATVVDADGEALTLDLSGQFRSTGGVEVGLLENGAMSGFLDRLSSTLVLELHT